MSRTALNGARGLLVGLIAVATACSSQGDKPSQSKKKLPVVLAQIGARRVTDGDLRRRLQGFESALRSRYSRDVKLLRKVLVDLVDEAVLLADARQRGELRNVRITPRIHQQLRRRFEGKIFGQLRHYKPTAEQAQAYYDKHRSRFAIALDLEMREIVVATRAQAEKLVDEVRRIEPDPHKRKGASFRDLAKRHSIDPLTKHRGGHHLSFSKPSLDVPEPVFRATLTLTKRWQVSPPVKSSKGWHVIQLLRRQDARQRTLDEVLPSIRAILRQQRAAVLIKAALEGLRQKFKAQVFPERVVAPLTSSPKR